MRCFYHQDKEAIGSCKSCGKGLCPECAVDMVRGLACRGRCENDVLAIIDLVDRNIRLQPTATRLMQAGVSARIAGSLFYFAIGAVFLIHGLSSGRLLGMIFGGCFLAYALFHALWSRRIAAPAPKLSP
jgi:hypothetical protein